MLDDGLVPAVDSRAANDPLLQKIVEAGSLLYAIGTHWEDGLRAAEESDYDFPEISEILDQFDLTRMSATKYLVHLYVQFDCCVEWESTYSPGLRFYLVWHLSRASELINEASRASDFERSKLADRFREIADRITFAGTNPTEVRLAKHPDDDALLLHENSWVDSEYSGALYDRAVHNAWAKLDEEAAERGQGKFEWPILKPDLYQSEYQPKASGIPQAGGIDATSDPDFIRKMEELFSSFQRTTADSKADTTDKVTDKTKKLPQDGLTRRAINYVNKHRQRVQNGKAEQMDLQDLIAEFAGDKGEAEVERILRALRPDRHGGHLITDK